MLRFLAITFFVLIVASAKINSFAGPTSNLGNCLVLSQIGIEGPILPEKTVRVLFKSIKANLGNVVALINDLEVNGGPMSADQLRQVLLYAFHLELASAKDLQKIVVKIRKKYREAGQPGVLKAIELEFEQLLSLKMAMALNGLKKPNASAAKSILYLTESYFFTPELFHLSGDAPSIASRYRQLNQDFETFADAFLGSFEYAKKNWNTGLLKDVTTSIVKTIQRIMGKTAKDHMVGLYSGVPIYGVLDVLKSRPNLIKVLKKNLDKKITKRLWRDTIEQSGIDGALFQYHGPYSMFLKLLNKVYISLNGKSLGYDQFILSKHLDRITNFSKTVRKTGNSIEKLENLASLQVDLIAKTESLLSRFPLDANSMKQMTVFLSDYFNTSINAFAAIERRVPTKKINDSMTKVFIGLERLGLSFLASKVDQSVKMNMLNALTDDLRGNFVQYKSFAQTRNPSFTSEAVGRLNGYIHSMRNEDLELRKALQRYFRALYVMN